MGRHGGGRYVRKNPRDVRIFDAAGVDDGRAAGPGALSGGGGGGEGEGSGGAGEERGGYLQGGPVTPLQPQSAPTPSTAVAAVPASAAATPPAATALSSTTGSGPAFGQAPPIPVFNQGQNPQQIPAPPYGYYNNPAQPYVAMPPAIPGPAGAGHQYQAGEPKAPVLSVNEIHHVDQVPAQNVSGHRPNDASGVVGYGPEFSVNQVLATGEKFDDDLEKEFPSSLRSHTWTAPGLFFRWRNPNHFKRPGFRYLDSTPGQPKHRHRDGAGRITNYPISDRYIHPVDGCLRNLYVQAVDDIFLGRDNSTWRRTWIRNAAPLQVRMATWVMDFTYDPKSWKDWALMLARSFPVALAITLVFWEGDTARTTPDGHYDAVHYYYWGDAKVWANYMETHNGSPTTAAIALSQAGRSPDHYHVLKPRHLYFLREPLDHRPHGSDPLPVEEWEASASEGATLDYVFVAYSTAQFNGECEDDVEALHAIGEAAARAAKVGAYWVAEGCMDEETLEADVFRIADVLRGAHSMVIAVGQSGTKGWAKPSQSTDELLAEWGKRMWTFPEVLLSPGPAIKIYTRGSALAKPIVLAKNHFAGRVWGTSDAAEARQLVDHFLGNLLLSRLELAVTALNCLFRRDTVEHLPGDQAYALMGLLRVRPQIDGTDSPFQAFARLSLANDSDKLLERYICTLPRHPLQDWHDMSDQYGSRLWDIQPYGQVAGICEGDNAIILDGALAASIRWKSFYRPWYLTNGNSWKRTIAVQLINYQLTVLITMAVLFAVKLTGPAIIALIIWLAIFVSMPTLLRLEHGGKFVYSQASLFGFEGYLNDPTIERAIYGGSFGRFHWSTAGSPLSRARVNKHGEKVGLDPTKDPNVRIKVEQAKLARPGEMRIFTLVDTYNMEITLFEAVRPPTVLLCLASEGGMQRAVACSYDWTTSTLYRETVLRMPSLTLNRMDRVSRVRFGIRRQERPSAPWGTFPQVETA